MPHEGHKKQKESKELHESHVEKSRTKEMISNVVMCITNGTTLRNNNDQCKLVSVNKLIMDQHGTKKEPSMC